MQSIICLSSGEVHFKNIVHASVLADTFQSEPPNIPPIYPRKSIHTLENKPNENVECKHEAHVKKN